MESTKSGKTIVLKDWDNLFKDDNNDSLAIFDACDPFALYGSNLMSRSYTRHSFGADSLIIFYHTAIEFGTFKSFRHESQSA